MRSAILAGLIGAFSVLGYGIAEANGQVSIRELRQLFPGTFQAVVRGRTVKFIAKRDGSLSGKHPLASDSGRWSIRNGRVCIMLEKWLRGQTKCSHIGEDGDWYKAKEFRFRKM